MKMGKIFFTYFEHMTSTKACVFLFIVICYFIIYCCYCYSKMFHWFIMNKAYKTTIFEYLLGRTNAELYTEIKLI